MSERLRTWGLRLLALAIAVALWYGVSLEGRETMTERIIEASVSYNRPRGFMILDPVQSVNVRLRGSSKKVRTLNPYLVNVQVDLNQSQKGTFSVGLGPTDVQLPEGFEVVSIDPNVIRVELDREVTQRLPVRPQLVGEPIGGATVGEPEVLPNQVMVSGPESLISKYDWINTRPISLDQHDRTFEEPISVIPPDPLIQVVQPSKVTVRVPIEPPSPESGATAPKKRK
ncbi:MAG TPA: CdaR family protein [Thermoanaerobaculia bacterium]|nr:CdaR family protein [Thermoanaerobaculia bacterium]